MFGECHAHIFMNGFDYRKAVKDHRDRPDEAEIRRALEAYRTHGVAFVRDGGDHFGASLLARRLAPEYGITYLTPGFARWWACPMGISGSMRPWSEGWRMKAVIS